MSRSRHQKQRHPLPRQDDMYFDTLAIEERGRRQRREGSVSADVADMDAFRGANSVCLMYALADEMGAPGDCGVDCNCVDCEEHDRRQRAEDLASQPFACECC